MKHCYGIFLFLLFTIALQIFPQPNSHYPDSSIQYPVYQPKVGIKRPDYRNRINIPEYDPSLMPLKTVRTGTGVWTELNPKVPRVDYIGLDFINPDTGWFVGYGGAVIKTTNSGISWETLQTPTTEILLKVHSYNGRVLMIVGQNGTILRSSDGGDSLTLLSGITTNELWGVKMLNDTLGWICGTNQTLLKTTDAGLSWQSVSTGFPNNYWSFDFLPVPSGDENYIMIVCSGGKVLKTTNGGMNWTEYQAGNTESLYTIDIIDSLHIAAAGNYGKNVYSSDGGTTWITSPWASPWPINWIQYVNRDTGYIALSEYGSLYKTTNRGQDWSGAGGGGWWQIELLEDGTGYCGGQGLNLYKRTDGFDNWKKLFLNEDWSDVFFLNEMKGFLSSAKFGIKLYKTENGGNTYQVVENSPAGIYDILFLDTLTGFLGSNTIYKTTDGGDTWYPTNTLGLGAGKIFFINHSTGWATSGRNILKTTDGGENWFVQITLPSDSYTSIYFIDSLNGWATSRYIWQTTNGGQNWIQRTDVQLYFNRNIYFTSIDTGFVTVDMTNTGSHDLFKTTNGGISWQRETRIETSYNIHAFPNKYHWISNGWSMGQVFETTDNGNSWEEISGELPAIFGQFHSPIEYIGYAVSGYGLILKYFDTTYVPVELTQLTARYSLNKIELNWSTASEVNNYGFYVEKSYNKVDWNILGFVPGNGTSTTTNDYSFSDYDIDALKIYYRLKQIDYDGSYSFSNILKINYNFNISSYKLYQNYPNPFNPTTKIQYDIPTDTKVQLKIYDILGREIKTLVNEFQSAGKYTVDFSANNISSGVYIYQLSAKGFVKSRKLMVIK